MQEILPVWRQPVMGETLPRAALSLPGLEALQLFTSRRVLSPPVSHLAGMRLVDVSPGAATFEMPVTGWLVGPQGKSYLGVLAILADGPLGCAIQTSLAAGLGYSTTELGLSLVRPVPATGTLTAIGRLIYSGHSTALADAEVVADDGRLVAHCTTRCSVFPFPASGEPLGDLPVKDVELPEHSPFRQPVRGEVLDASAGAATFSLPAHAWLTQPLGFVEGGVTACLADSAMAAAVQTTVSDGRAFAPIDLRVNFLRPVPPDGRELTAPATLFHRGRTMAYTRADVLNADGKVVAMATSTSLYR